jgi:hypothetical protein
MAIPHTEADPAAILLQFLVGFGNVIGRGPHAEADCARHGTNLAVAIVGKTAGGRKGTGLRIAKYLLQDIDPDWAVGRITQGLSSGEGLIREVRDPIERTDPIKEKGRVVGYDTYTEDQGVEDKRLLVTEEEFARPLKAMEREGNILSTVIREAWDGNNLRTMVNSPGLKATAPHISLIFQISIPELHQRLSVTDQVNGFGNRILWCLSRRSKILPEGGALYSQDFRDVIRRLREVIENSRQDYLFRRDAAAKEAWASVYEELSGERPGTFGFVTARAEAQALRLSVIYALLDRSLVIQTEHVQAALAVWTYCEDSAKYIFGTKVGDPVADAILEALKNKPEGLTRTEIRDLFGRNQSAERISHALAALTRAKLVNMKHEASGGGRPIERWTLANPPTT